MAKTRKTKTAKPEPKAKPKKTDAHTEAENQLRRKYPKLNIVPGSLLLPGDSGNPHRFHRLIMVGCKQCDGHRQIATSDLFHFYCDKCRMKEKATAKK